MQLFGNVATDPVRKESKTTGKGYFEMRVAESQRGVDTSPTWYSVRVMRDSNLGLKKGDFVKVTGKLKVDFYLGRDGKPTGTLLVIAFEASKISKSVGDGQGTGTRESVSPVRAKVLDVPAQTQVSDAGAEVNWDSLV